MSNQQQSNYENQVITQSITDLGNKFDAKAMIEATKELITSGNIDPLAPYTVLKRMVKVAEEVFKDENVKKTVLNEADKHLSGNSKTFNCYSATITKAATYTTYDFKDTGHTVLLELYEIQKQVNAYIKNIEDELKLLIPDERQMSIQNDSKTIIIEKVPKLEWLNNEDQVIVKAPRKIQTYGLKYMKI